MKNLEAVIAAHLIAGKNVIIYGPPGIGKTTLAKKICGDLASGYYSVTGNPEWTVFDVIGGRNLTGEFRFGFLSEAVVKCWNMLAAEGKPYWLLIDEINRTNADLAFGNAFTTMDLIHRGAVPLLSLSPFEKEKLPDDAKKHFENNDLFTPYSFRIVSTMNSYDRALLFKLGFALIRRFALIPMSLKPYILEETNEKFLEKAKALINETKAGQSYLYESAKQELILCRKNLKDFLVIKEDFFNGLSSGFVDNYFDGVSTTIGFSPFDLLEAICNKINSEMEGAVEVGKAFSLDASKFIIAAYLIFEGDISRIMKALVDEAVAAYIIPQLDVLSEKVRAERMGLYTDIRISKKIESLTNVLSDMNLSFRTVPLLKKILAGERVL
ncbi:MAG: AAA family ATPase [Conexivisphaerales archaeon]